MAVRSAVKMLGNLVVNSGKAGGQTILGGVQSGGELVLASNPNSDGTIAISGVLFIDESGTIKRLGVKTLAPQNEVDLPLDIRVRGAGTGTATFVDDVLVVAPSAGGGGGGGFFSRDTSQPAGWPAVLVPVTNTDALNVGPESFNYGAQSIVNVPNGFPGNQAFTIVKNDTPLNFGQALFMVATSGSVGVGTQTPPSSAEGAANVFRIFGMPLALAGANWEFEGGSVPPSLASTPSTVLRLKQGGQIYYIPAYASTGGVTGATVSDNFTRANSTTSLGTANPTGQAWTANEGTWGISTNAGYCVANGTGLTNNFALASVAGQSANGVITAKMSAFNDAAGIFWRGNALGTNSHFFYACHYFQSQNRYDILYWNSGAWTSPNAAITSRAPVANDIIRVTLSSSSPMMKVEISSDNGATFAAIWTSNATDDGSGGFCTHFTGVNAHGLKNESAGAARWVSYTFT